MDKEKCLTSCSIAGKDCEVCGGPCDGEEVEWYSHGSLAGWYVKGHAGDIDYYRSL